VAAAAAAAVVGAAAGEAQVEGSVVTVGDVVAAASVA
jgi:hypothetical protein